MFSLKKMFGGKDDKKVILAPVEGKAVSLKEVNDPTFSQEILGKGVAVIPSKGRVVAPADGVVSVFLRQNMRSASPQTTVPRLLFMWVLTQ